MTFANRLKSLRLSKELTQEDLGKILNISARVIGYYESGERFPKDNELLIKIANYFGVSLDYLLGKTDIKKSISDFSQNEQDFLLFARHSEEIDEKDRSQLKTTIKDTIDVYLKRRNEEGH